MKKFMLLMLGLVPTISLADSYFCMTLPGNHLPFLTAKLSFYRNDNKSLRVRIPRGNEYAYLYGDLAIEHDPNTGAWEPVFSNFSQWNIDHQIVKLVADKGILTGNLTSFKLYFTNPKDVESVFYICKPWTSPKNRPQYSLGK